jgi:hypothetical protein
MAGTRDRETDGESMPEALYLAPEPLSPAQWARISFAAAALAVFTAATLAGALAFLLAHAILPSLRAEAPSLPDWLRLVRLALYGTAAAALVPAGWALAAALRAAVDVVRAVYPRFLI